ncbi:MAG: nucleotidyl transferase AbiEii/AbiGii toxin family protein [Candidatus Bathyarchaeota archaeon]|nr:nucleotidyl transferase AbiEii/AbiGii toxin family protein [Candidatus Bathyarchaeota archaeon]
MLNLTNHDLKVWADEQNLPDLLFAELDYRLVKTLETLYKDEFLSKRLCIKGGTAINKLYLVETSRLSVDLDFNQIGPKEEVLRERPDVRERIVELLTKQDSSYEIHSEHRYEQTRIKSRYKTVAGPPWSFKIEISHVERFPIVSPVKKQVKTPDGLADVVTYTLEELTATKLRALLERFKGRDVYDLYFISQLKPNPTVIRKMFMYYFYRSRKVYNPKVHYKNLMERYEIGNYKDDVTDFVKPTVTFDLTRAAKNVISQYSFLNQFDSQDKDFLKLAGILLGKRVPKESIDRLKTVDKPFKLLFDSINISQEASEISTDEIRLFRKKKRIT